ncbi:MAG: PKD domain-containing protein, partial [Thermoplasmatales archaeon]|nr:PKD domain-containing protein [Thermoplasmatales archaeon]
VVQSQPLAKKTFETSMQPLSFAGVSITGGDYDEYHGSVAGAPGGEFYAMAEYTEDDVIWHPMMYSSSDGAIWDPLVEFLYDNSEYTDMDQNAHGTYGTFGAPPDDNGIIAVLQGEIADGWIWDFGEHFINEFSHNRIDCYTFEGPDGDPGTWNWGGLTMTGYNGYSGNDIEGCPYLFYQYSGAGGGVIGWLTGDTAGCEHVGSAMDLATNMHYAVYDRDTGSGNYDLLVRKDDFGSWTYNSAGDYWTHDMVTNLKITDTANLMYPSAAAYDDNVIVACQKDDDVIVYYSTNGFSSYTEVLVQDSASYPEVAMAGGGTAVITYIKDGTLYYRTSDTGGASWSDADVVSDNQVNLNDRAANLDEYNGAIIGVWEDTRGDNIDIYFDLVFGSPNDPPEAPTITGETNGDAGTAYEYTFTATDPDGDDIAEFLIDWGDETQDTLAGPSPAKMSHTYSAGGDFIITARAKDVNGLIGPKGSLTVTMPRSRTIDLPILKFLQNYPILFKIVQHLFGL